MLGLYIHTPFCEKVCDYCDFSVLSAPDRLLDEYLELLAVEMQLLFKRFPDFTQKFQTIYWGGGTPSILNAKRQNKIFDMLWSHGVGVENLKEFSMELNPESCSQEVVENAIQNGVNRFSLGIQSFKEHLLQKVGRAHSVKTALVALEYLESLRSQGISVSVDLMFNLPGQSVEDFLEDLEFLVKKPIDHISFYGLTVASYTALGTKIKRGELFVDDNLFGEMYLQGVKIVENNGFKRYETSNFAKIGKERLHNQNYWDRGFYLGLGAGAHSFVGNTRFFAPESYAQWRSWVQADCPEKALNKDELDFEAIRTESIWLGLRCSKGFDLQKVKVSASKLKKWTDKGMLQIRNNRVSLRDEGWILMDRIVQDLL